MEPFELPPEIFGQVPLFAELSKAMSWTGGPVNWDIARQIATALANNDQRGPVISEDREELQDAVRLTRSWLSDGTGIPEPATQLKLVVPTASGWVERALASYPEVIEPLAAKLVGTVAAQGGEAAEEDPMAKVLGQLMPLFLGIQAGSVIGSLARTAWTGYDIPVPLEDDATVTILVTHLDAHARDFGIDRRELRYWATLRAVTTGAIFDALSWPRTHFYSLYHQYLAGMDVDLSDALERLTRIDMTDPEQIRQALGSGVFGLGDAPSAGPALAALHRFLGLMAATTDAAVAEAGAGRFSQTDKIVASQSGRGGRDDPATLLSRFLGLEVAPDVARQASVFCGRVLAAGGWPALLVLWSEPDRLPSPSAFADPDSWL